MHPVLLGRGKVLEMGETGRVVDEYLRPAGSIERKKDNAVIMPRPV